MAVQKSEIILLAKHSHKEREIAGKPLQPKLMNIQIVLQKMIIKFLEGLIYKVLFLTYNNFTLTYFTWVVEKQCLKS